MISARRGIAVVALAAGLAACSSPTTPEQANAAFCTDVAALQVQTTKLQAMVLEGSSTLADVQAQVDEIEKAVDQTKESATDVAGNTAAELESADKAFDDAIAAIPSDASVEQAKAAYTAALVQYTAAVAAAKSDASC